MARSDELLDLANRIDAAASEVGPYGTRDQVVVLQEIAKELRQYVKEG